MHCKAQTAAKARLWRGFATPQGAQSGVLRAARDLFRVALSYWPVPTELPAPEMTLLPGAQAASEPAKRLPRWARRLALALLVLLAFTLVLLLGAAAWYSPQLPPLDRVTAYQPRQPLQVFTADGIEIAQFGAERRQFVPIGQIPVQLQQAVLAVEDTRFREHVGIDPKGVLRALFAAATGGLRQGASTITQQVARTFFLSSRLTPERKLKEALLALKIERQLSKDQILELYMNQIYLGQRAYGFAAAADTYFGKPLAALTLAEAAMLAGLPQNPSYANPVVNLARATQRQRTVLQRMRTTGVIDEAQQAAARAQTLQIRSALQVPLHAEHVAEMARRLVVDRFGTEVYSQGIKVTTSLHSGDQQAAWARCAAACWPTTHASAGAAQKTMPTCRRRPARLAARSTLPSWSAPPQGPSKTSSMTSSCVSPSCWQSARVSCGSSWPPARHCASAAPACGWPCPACRPRPQPTC